jgi:AcrR family transcriptional regulator
MAAHAGTGHGTTPTTATTCNCTCMTAEPLTPRTPTINKANSDEARLDQAATDQARTRMERFLDSARAIIAEKGSIEFTVQEVVDRSKQSLRSFYQYFDGKNALLLALFDEEMGLFVERMREGTAAGDPLDRLRDTVLMLYDLCAPGRLSVQPLFADFAQRLIVEQPDDVTAAYAPVIEYIASIVDDAAAADLLRPGRPHRLATIVLQTATITAGRASGGQPISGDEVWEFCLHAIVPDDILEPT